MAVDMFMKIGDIAGESVDDKHKGEIEVMSFSWGASQSGSLAFGGGGGAGKVQFQDFHFTTQSSKASPKLMLACATGEHIKKAELFCSKVDNDRSGFEFMKLTLSDVLISSYNQSGSGENPTESVSIAFAKVEFIWFTPAPDGGIGSSVSAGWDVKANKKI
jgi:type VI secretion system secreted protein Hcp